MRRQPTLSPTLMPRLKTADEISPLSSPPISLLSLDGDGEDDDCINVPTATHRIPRFNPVHPFRPISYPYSATQLGHKLRTTLRPRRRSSLYRLGQRRILHAIFALSIPVLILLLLGEWSTHAARVSAQTMDRNVLHHASTVDLRGIRDAYETRKRKDIVVSRSQPNQVKRSLRELEKEGNMGNVAWTLEEEVELKKEVRDVWPEWWGNVDEVGRSPYDHIPQTEGKRRILFLTDYYDYLDRMNTHTYEIVDAALRHPNAIVDVWGPGWKGYNKSEPLSINIKRRQNRIHQIESSLADHTAEVERRNVKGWFARTEEAEMQPWSMPAWDIETDEKPTCGPVKFDIAWTISDIYKQNDRNVDALDCGSLLVQQLGDCHSWRCMKEWYPLANNITLSKYAFELPEIFDYAFVKEKFPEWEMGLFGHSPDTANEWDFYPARWADKTSDATMFGYDGSFYPIRTTVTDHTRNNPSAAINRHEHPGYSVPTAEHARQNPLETYTKGHELYTKHEELRADFSKAMRRAKICVFDASLERKMIRKYAQALLSGCVIAGDLPTEHEEALERFTIKLKPSWDIERIEQEINKYLAQPEKLHQMAVDGVVYARQHLTSTKKVTDVIRMADAHNAGIRGYDFPYSFSLRCRAYWSDNEAYRPPWCSKSGGYRGLEA